MLNDLMASTVARMPMLVLMLVLVTYGFLASKKDFKHWLIYPISLWYIILQILKPRRLLAVISNTIL